MNAVLVYFLRDMRRWVRGRFNVWSALVMPAAWLIFVGLALPTRFSDHYLDFIAPGILVLTMLTAGMQGGSSLIFDKILGFLNKFLALPSPREAILFGKILFTTVRGLLAGDRDHAARGPARRDDLHPRAWSPSPTSCSSSSAPSSRPSRPRSRSTSRTTTGTRP